MCQNCAIAGQFKTQCSFSPSADTTAKGVHVAMEPVDSLARLQALETVQVQQWPAGYQSKEKREAAWRVRFSFAYHDSA
jgi:hypothetical protein